MSQLWRDDQLSTKKYELNDFHAATSVDELSYTSGRVLKPVYNRYQKNRFSVFGYFSDWCQYDGRLDGLFGDSDCGRGIDLMLIDAFAYDKIVLGFAGIIGDEGSKKVTIDNAAKQMHLGMDEATFVDPWGDLLSYRNVGSNGWVSNDPLELYSQAKAQGVLGGLRMVKEKNPDLKIALSIGGWTMSQAFHFFAKEELRRLTFAKSVAKIMKLFPMITGLDIDWEYPNAPGDMANTYGPEDMENFPLLIKNVLNILRQEGLDYVKVSIACSCDPDKIKAANIPGLVKAGLSGINLMSYDLFGTPWAQQLAHHTNLMPNGQNNNWSVDTGVRTLLDLGVPSQMIFVGYAAYSRSAKDAQLQKVSPLAGTYSPGQGITTGSFESGTTEWFDVVYNYLDLEGRTDKNGFVLYTDEKADADFLYSPKSNLFLSIDTPRTVRAKAKYVVKNNLGGLFTWLIEADRGLLVNAAREGLGCPVSGTATIDMSKFYYKGKTNLES